MRYWPLVVLAITLPFACGDRDPGSGGPPDGSIKTFDGSNRTTDGSTSFDGGADGDATAVGGDLTSTCQQYCEFVEDACLSNPGPECQAICQQRLTAADCSQADLNTMLDCLTGACDETTEACIDNVPCLYRPPCGDDLCEAGENASTCPDDCQAECGNATCEPGECTTCAADCPLNYCSTCEAYCDWKITECMTDADPACQAICADSLVSLQCTSEELTDIVACFEKDCFRLPDCFQAVPCLAQ